MKPSNFSYGRLFARADAWFECSHAALNHALPCRRGCFRCCIGPFAITILDVLELQRGLQILPASTRRDIQSRAATQVTLFEETFPSLRTSPFVDAWPEQQLDAVAEQFAELPCPALDTDGSCRVYAFRPLACRTMGIPVERDGLVEGACEVQTFVPITRLPSRFRKAEQDLARNEAREMKTLRRTHPGIGEDVLLAYGFLPELVLNRSSRRRRTSKPR